ncbi:MAG TPA: hypothetical protein VJB90_02625 [Candidatus Nanoarchaeia archaeon]|nr:hypothetical protein [Candidatus Nanoarchaeia archaeon]
MAWPFLSKEQRGIKPELEKKLDGNVKYRLHIPKSLILDVQRAYSIGANWELNISRYAEHNKGIRYVQIVFTDNPTYNLDFENWEALGPYRYDFSGPVVSGPPDKTLPVYGRIMILDAPNK